MDPENEKDILTPLMRRDHASGHRQFVTNCFLLLDPKEIKACRLVCKEWSVFVGDDLWCSRSGREKLSQKLAHR